MNKKEGSKIESYLNLIQEIIIELDINGDVVFINKNGYKMLGYPKKQIIGKNWFENFIPKELSGELKAEYGKLMKGTIEKFEYFENPILTNEGNKINIVWHNAILKDENGNIYGALSSGRDLTEIRKEKKSKEKILATLNCGLFIYNMNKQVVEYINSEHTRITGWSAEEANKMGRNFFKLFHPDDMDMIMENINEIGRSRKDITIKASYRIKSKDERWIWCLSYNTPFDRDEHGNVISFIGSFVDITEQKNFEEQLQKEKNFSESIMNTAQIIIVVLDKEGKILSINPYLEKLSGYKLADVKGKDWFTTFLPQCDYDKIRKLFKKAVSNIQTRGNVNPILTKKGKEIIIEWNDSTLRDEEGKTIGLVAIGQDITVRGQIENEIKNKLLKLEELQKEHEKRHKKLCECEKEVDELKKKLDKK